MRTESQLFLGCSHLFIIYFSRSFLISPLLPHLALLFVFVHCTVRDVHVCLSVIAMSFVSSKQ